jgi:hypothetical protein
MILAEWMGDAIIKDRGPSAKREVAFSREENDVIDPCHPPPSHLFDVGALNGSSLRCRTHVLQSLKTRGRTCLSGEPRNAITERHGATIRRLDIYIIPPYTPAHKYTMPSFVLHSQLISLLLSACCGIG